MKADTIAEQLFFMTVRLEVLRRDGATSVGTGFFFRRATDDGQFLMIITNKHVIDDAATLSVTMTCANSDGTPDLGVTTTTVMDFSGWPVVAHSNASVDVAAIAAGPLLNKLANDGQPAFFRSLSDEFVITTEILDSLDAIEDVTFVGYPIGLFDTANHLPIARRGSTATPLSVDYRGEPTFLIDASVFPGSSGSPVFLFDRGGYTDRYNNAYLGTTRFSFLGILAAVHVRSVSGAIVESLTTLGVSVDEPIDLGIVFKASTVTEVADQIVALFAS